MSLSHRRGNIQDSTGTAQASWTVTAYEAGAYVTSGVTGRTLTVRAGHGFASGDKFIVGTDETTYRSVDSTTTTTVVIPAGEAVLTVVADDVLLNLGPDGGTTSPDWDGSAVSIYDEPSGAASALSNSRVTTDSDGEFGYYYAVGEVWEAHRDSSGTLQQVEPFVSASSVAGPTSSTDNALARFNGTTGKLLQDYASGAPTVGDTGDATFAGEVEIDGDLNHDGSNVGFYGTAPAAQASAYTQTYSTADRTHANLTSATLTDSSGGSTDDTVAAITAIGGSGATTAQEGEINDNFAEVTEEINALRVDLVDLKQLVNSLIDDLQALGLVQ